MNRLSIYETTMVGRCQGHITGFDVCVCVLLCAVNYEFLMCERNVQVAY
jgi:hypothetical protein